MELPPELPPIEGQPGGATITYGPGKCSHFGGPEDTGVKPDEGLALITSVFSSP